MAGATIDWSFGGVRGRRIRRVGVLALTVLVLGAAGCGSNSSTANVSGTVTLNGQPLPDRLEAPTIMFAPVTRGRVKGTSAPIVEGQYTAKDVPKGQVRVSFSLSQWTGKMIQEAGGTPFKEMVNILPAKYASGVEIKVDGNNSELNFDLSEEGTP